MTGELVGQGCEAHESKAAARKDRLAMEKKNKQEARRESRARKAEHKRKERGKRSPDLVEHKMARVEEAAMSKQVEA